MINLIQYIRDPYLALVSRFQQFLAEECEEQYGENYPSDMGASSWKKKQRVNTNNPRPSPLLTELAVFEPSTLGYERLQKYTCSALYPG